MAKGYDGVVDALERELAAALGPCEICGLPIGPNETVEISKRALNRQLEEGETVIGGAVHVTCRDGGRSSGR